MRPRNPTRFRYSYTAKQEPKQELGDALKVAFLNCLKTYFRHNQAWPELVVVFRAGVYVSLRWAAKPK